MFLNREKMNTASPNIHQSLAPDIRTSQCVSSPLGERRLSNVQTFASVSQVASGPFEESTSVTHRVVTHQVATHRVATHRVSEKVAAARRSR